MKQAGRLRSPGSSRIARCILSALSTLLFGLSASSGSEDPWRDLIQRLILDGQDPSYVRQVFSSASVEYDPRVMAKKLAHEESKLDYGQFLERRNLDKVRGFLTAKSELLARIQSEYGVSSEILAAVYMVETNLGSYLGKTPVFTVFVNMAASSELDRIAPFLSSELLAGSRKEETRRRCQEKAQWAYNELLSLLIFCKRNGYDPTEIRGSVFGAFGRCQFLPSSASRYGVDADEDGKVDLFDEPEALASMANYLRAYGWRGDLVREEQAAVLYEYNRSRPYVKTVLAMAERLRELKKTPAAY